MLPAPTCIFHCSKADKKLKPIVIEIDHPTNSSSVFAGKVAVLPFRRTSSITNLDQDQEEDHEEWKWLIAKTAVRCADTNYFQSVSHYLYGHLAPEIVAVSAHRSLPKAHPIMRFLEPHFRGTIIPNTFARSVILDRVLTTMSIKGAIPELLHKAWHDNDLHDRLLCFPKDLKHRNISKDVLPDYPYRDDGGLVYGAIKKYASSFVQEVYPSDELLNQDVYVENFQLEMTNTGYFGWDNNETPSAPSQPLTSSRGVLIDFLSSAVFNATATHGTMNYNMYETLGFAPSNPFVIRRLPPSDNWEQEHCTKEGYLGLLPSLENAAMNSMAAFLSERNEHDEMLGEFDNLSGEFLGSVARKRLHLDLAQISKFCKDRNEKRSIKYDLLIPSNITNSVVA
ncbi:MAG: hypothetical protein SGILL_003271 [Bacillariaceae sp.]